MREKIVIIFAVVVAFVAAMPTGSANIKEAKTAVAVMKPADGKALYAEHCARCHGTDGRGRTALGRTFKCPDLTSSKTQGRSDSRFRSAIKNGRGNMPAFAKKLSAQDILALIAYIRSLKG